MIVQSRDGYFYDEPVIILDKAYIHFIDGGAEIVCQPKVSVKKALDSSGVPASLGEKVEITQRVFPGSDEVLQRANAWKLTLHAPIPTPTAYKHKLDSGYGDDVLVWYMKVPMIDAENLLRGVASPGLVKFLIGVQPIPWPDQLKLAKLAFLRQHPNFTVGDLHGYVNVRIYEPGRKTSHRSRKLAVQDRMGEPAGHTA